MNDTSILKARAVYYNLFSKFFVYSTQMSNYEDIIKILKILKENPLDTPSSTAVCNLLEKLDETSNKAFLLEFDNIFNNPQTSTIHATASYYDEGIESGKKRLEMLQFLAKTKIRRNEKEFFDYEDSVGFIVTVLAQLIELVADNQPEYETTVHCIFKECLNEFIDAFAKEVYEHECSDYYKEVIVILHSFLEFERLYLEVSKPRQKEIIKKEDKKNRGLSEEEIARRARNKALKALGPKV